MELNEFTAGDIIIRIDGTEKYVVMGVDFISAFPGSPMYCEYKVVPYPVMDTKYKSHEFKLPGAEASMYFVKCESVYDDGKEVEEDA